MAPLISWFGDDFTGAAAVMEVLAFAGLETVLFADMPDESLLARFRGARAVGIASTARTEGPEWMEAHLPQAFAFLQKLGAPLLHYKVCSTFDSAPEVGSIGKAAEIGLRVTQAQAAAMLTAAPQMRRYQAFGHLYAGGFDGVHRLDRHPVMSRHPVTPMDESDLLRHIARQTDLPSALIDLEALWSGFDAPLQAHLQAGARLISVDAMEATSERAAGRLIWESRAAMPFVIGSQGVEFALVRHWQAKGDIPAAPAPRSAGKVEQIAVVSGSVSPSTAQQIAWAEANGFAVIRLDAVQVIGDGADAAIEVATKAALAEVAAGRSPLVCSATGPDDPAVADVRAAVAASGAGMEAANKKIGIALGHVLDGILKGSAIRRAVISGGDTSGHGMRVLGLKALQALAPTIPGASLCVGYGEGPHDGLQIALKGGQMGSMDFFGWIRDGGGPR